MLTGRMPFPDPNANWEEFCERVQKGDWDVEELEDSEVSERAFDLIGQCLAVDPADRPSANDLLEHPFFEACHLRDVKATVETLGGLLEGSDDVDYGYGVT
jgi:serine/threonine protein kinase